jgi:hypothetical protein
MYLALFLDQSNYEFNVSLHSSLAGAKAAYADMVRHFGVKQQDEYCFCDDAGEAPHIYRIECDGESGEEIFLSRPATADDPAAVD